jgi:hypothetical protein
LTTPKLLLPELVVGQAGKELTHNQALAILDQLTQPIVVDKDLSAPPGSPANGAMYIVAAAATGLWVGQSGKLAVWLTTVAAWTFIAPANGWSVWVNDESKRYELLAGVWTIVASSASGDVSGPASSVDNEVSRFNGVTGKLLKAGLKYQASVTDVTAGSLVIQGGSNLSTTDTVAIGYAAGAGGAVTQLTNKSTSVTLNKVSGKITTASGSISAGDVVAFTVNNNKVSIGDVIAISAIAGTGGYIYHVDPTGVDNGVFQVRIRNWTGTANDSAIQFNFVVIKGASS